MYQFKESFACYDENYKPYGILTESCSQYWHQHAVCTREGFAIHCTGNKYLLKTPRLLEFSVKYAFCFGALNKAAGANFYFGYDPDHHRGYNVMLLWNKADATLKATLFEIRDECCFALSSRCLEKVPFPEMGAVYLVSLCYEKGRVALTVDGCEPFVFDVCCDGGYVGFSRPHFIGSVIFRSVALEADLEEQPLRTPQKVEIPQINGGTMPLTLEYSFFEVSGQSFLRATLDGGPQYRSEENYHPYPCNKKGQYVVEEWFLEKPYVAYAGKKYLFKNGRLMLTDPGLCMKEILSVMLDISDLPLTLTVAVDGCDSSEIGFGYEMLEVNGYDTQKGGNEFRYALDGAYLGEVIPEDCFRLCSPTDKTATRIIPKSAFAYETVREHFAKAHYFADGEEIFFKIDTNTEKRYLQYHAELQDVYGIGIEELSVSSSLEIRHPALPVGLYRVFLRISYGGEPFKTVDTVFEVFDREGKKCAPLESGLPVLFAMPNEQQYLDRDVFDPWNPGHPSNVEHFCSVNAFTGHVAEHKRTWEVTKLFARKWYVWLSDHRSMVDHDYRDHMDIVKNADYIYYPADYEWGVLRSDSYSANFWGHNPAFSAMLDEFLDAHEGAREQIGHVRGADLNKQSATKLYQYYRKEWTDFSHARIKEGFLRQNELFKRLNPNLKRACYGPFAAYVANLRTSKLSEDYGFERDDTLSDVIYTGFAQFEDYPLACAYQTYRGAFGVGATLVSSPKLKIYPEQYDSSCGGCIDGAVYFANPPVGAYEKPAWFDTTHAREYVYNTPRKTAEGFDYWRSYGFMKTGMTDGGENTDRFIKEWRYVLEHRPEKPLRSAMLICEFPRTDDGFDGEYPGWRIPHNVSEEGIGYVYETTRLAGLPAGFFGDWQTLQTVKASDVDLLVIPSVESAPEEAIAHVRRLHADGVSLIAVSRVDGLEDLFGVRYAPKKVKYYALKADGERESVCPYEETARYESDGAEVMLWADETAAVYRHGRTALFNISPMALGKTYFYKHAESARSTNSALLRRIGTALVKALSKPIAEADACGITLTQDQNGNTLLLAIDYSDHNASQIGEPMEKTVLFREKIYRDAVCLDGKPIRRLLSEDGRLDGVVITLRQHESALIKLI